MTSPFHVNSVSIPATGDVRCRGDGATLEATLGISVGATLAALC